MLVAGVGNIFFGDDGFGVEVARQLAARDGLPDGVTVADYGISGMHLAYDLAAGFSSAILVDAAPRGGEPGTVYVIEPQPQEQEPPDPQTPVLLDGHGMQPDVVMKVLGMLGEGTGSERRMLVVGCEPASTSAGIGLSDPVAAAVGEAVRVVLRLLGECGSESSAGGSAGTGVVNSN